MRVPEAPSDASVPADTLALAAATRSPTDVSAANNTFRFMP